MPSSWKERLSRVTSPQRGLHVSEPPSVRSISTCSYCERPAAAAEEEEEEEEETSIPKHRQERSACTQPPAAR